MRMKEDRCHENWARSAAEKLKNDSVLMSLVNNLRLLKHLEYFKSDFAKSRVENYSFL
jgi:hypothetical protein